MADLTLTVTSCGAVTNPGLRRPINEDSIVASHPVFLVADGMGGHQAGDAASRTVADRMRVLVGTKPTVDTVKAALGRAGEAVTELAGVDPERAAGTTVSGVVAVTQEGIPYWLVVNLGDSRTYRLTDGELEQLSVDHSEVQELISDGVLSSAQARSHPRRNVVTRAMGGGMHYDPDYWLVPMEENDRILVCSDGLTGELDDSQIAAILREFADPLAGARALMEAALTAGGKDNISVIVVDVIGLSDPFAADQTAKDISGDDTLPGDEDTVPRERVGRAAQ
ncbi:MAG: protein phosphatase 2C domain-containing protein [Bifidobacteriaceae bacterium]|jgi:protein phosphatase|nr:protein phosphatase 2C domain-containing protein [Bifidobacteriaceae bacterium]